MAKKAKPTNIPNKTKFIVFGFSIIIKTCSKDNDQNNINIISVETKKEEKETAGIRKKAAEVKIANSRFLYNFLEIKNIT